MKRGLLRLKVLNISFQPDWPFSGDYILRLANGGQVSDLLPNNIYAETIWMDLLSDSIEVSVMSRNPNTMEFGFADIRLTQICQYPDVLHKINVYVSAKDRMKGWLERDTGIVVLQLYYSSKPMNGNLMLEIIDADLYRDTEMIGKMDPYVIMRYGGGDRKTSTKNDAGKKPIWNQRFTFPVMNINQRMQLIVMDKDVTKDDEVGRCNFSFRELGLISQRETFRTLDLVYQKKGKNPEPAGLLRIKSLFTFGGM